MDSGMGSDILEKEEELYLWTMSVRLMMGSVDLLLFVKMMFSLEEDKFGGGQSFKLQRHF